MRVGIIDYGVGNLGSVVRCFEELRAKPVLINRPADLHFSECLVLPGVGNFTQCMRILNEGGWTSLIREEVLKFCKPILGICLGMQLLADFGEEGAVDGKLTKGLGLIPGTVKNIKSVDCKFRVPHMGWNSVEIQSGESLFQGIPSGTDFYFVHSYSFIPENNYHILATTSYEIDLVAAVRHKKICGTQFHPEKSSRAGFKVLKNFLENLGC